MIDMNFDFFNIDLDFDIKQSLEIFILQINKFIDSNSKMPFKSSTSMINLREKALEASEPFKHLVIKATDFSTYFSIFLANSKGKDKTIALFQYVFDFCCECGKNSNIDGMRNLFKKSNILIK